MPSQNKLFVECDEGVSFTAAHSALLQRAFETALAVGNARYPYQANLLVVDGPGIQRLNRDFRGKDAVTDVLSFPNAEPGDTPDFDHRTGRYELGDLAICLPRAQEQAQRYGHSLERELAFLLIHGTLHCLGYDHEQGETAEAEMRALQRQAFERLAAADGAEERGLVEAALVARQQAYAPYSRFRVGACLLAADGQRFTGCNVENAAYGACLCAERAALGAAVAAGCRNFLALAVAAAGEAFATPCGICRQALSEFGDMDVLCANEHGAYTKYRLRELLPAAFDEENMHGV